MLPNDIINDLDEVKRLLITAERRAESAESRAESAESRAKVAESALSDLEQELAALKRRHFGRRTERVDIRQMSLLDGEKPAEDIVEPTKDPQKKASPKRRSKHGRGRLAPELPRVPVASAAAGKTVCECCGDDLKVIGKEVSERLEYIPGRFVVFACTREKRACPACPGEGVTLQPAPVFGLDRALAADGLIAKIITDKYADHLPLNRQSRRFLRESGVNIATSTLCGWMKQSAELLKHVVATMSDSLREGPFIQSDATGLPILEGRKNKPRRGHLWSYSDGCQVVFVATMNGKQEHPAQFLAGFSGTLLTDGAGAYNLVAKSDGITRAGCWAHARRKFFEARTEEPKRVGVAMTQIREIFDLERQMTELAPMAKAKERQKVLAEPLRNFRVWLAKQSTVVRPTSGLGKAITYTLNQWDTLVVFLIDGRAPVDNNASERQLRGPVVGRKNWMFAGSEGGAHTAATLFSIVGSCVMAGIDPYAYLRDVLSLLPDATPEQLRELTPWAWAQRFGDDLV